MVDSSITLAPTVEVRTTDLVFCGRRGMVGFLLYTRGAMNV